ncbi:MAG: HEAT repeat domain-containing protein, partial [Candidatus Rokuibacteriota bacterium]
PVEAQKIMLKEGDLTRAASLAEALGKGQVGKPDQKLLLPLATKAVETIAASGVFRPLLDALKGSEPTRREQARAVLAALGEGTLQLVVNIISNEEEAEVRKIAATLLRSLPGSGLRLLVPQLHPPAPPEVTRRIVGVLDIVAAEMGPEFVFLLAHPDVLVRAEFTALVSRLPRAAALKFLRRALSERESRILLGALEGARGAQATELLEPILRLVTQGTSVEVVKAACVCLGQFKDQRAVGPLAEILQRRPRFWGLVKGAPETVRAAAGRALGELAFPEAQQALRAVLKDASLAVRSTARLALARVRPEPESK